MATPSQKIPLGDVIRGLTGDSKKLVKELEKERKALEKEIDKSLKAANQVDQELLKRLQELRQREGAARTVLERDKRERQQLQAIRGKGTDMYTLRSGFNIAQGRGGLMDLANITEALSKAAAKSGFVGLAKGLAGVGQAANVGMAVMGRINPIVGAAMAGYSTLESISKYVAGDPEEMKRRADETAAYQNAVWSNKNILGRAGTARMLSSNYGPERVGMLGGIWDSMWGQSRGLEPDIEANQRLQIELAKRKGLDTAVRSRALRAYYQKNRGLLYDEMGQTMGQLKDWVFSERTTDLENQRKKDEELVKIFEAEENARKAKQEAFKRSAIGLRTHVIEQNRLLGMARLQEEKWSGVSDWSM